MNELATVPTSLRQRLELAQRLFEDNHVEEGQQLLAQAHLELARMQPELCALIMAAQRGFRGIEATTVNEVTTMTRVQKTFFGLPLGEVWEPVTTTTVTKRTLKLF